jgi:hypothetical protein
VQFEIESVSTRPDQPTTTGSQRVAGIALKWREHPYEWIEGSRQCVLRVFEKGVLRWYIAEVQLERTAGGGTKLRNTVRLEPRGLLARVLSKWEIGVKYKRKLDKVYTPARSRARARTAPGDRSDRSRRELSARSGRASPTRCARSSRRCSTRRASEALGTYSAHASDQDVARMRPDRARAQVRRA